jgi:hypothetical protein
MWNYSPKEFVKVYRKLVNWEWYSDANTTKIFLHCLLRANWKEGSWKGIHYNSGQFITSLPSLAEENGLSVQEVRTALNHLFSTGEISSSTTDEVTGKKLTRNRIITVNNWDLYQASDRQHNRQTTDKSTDGQQASNRQATADIRNIEYIEHKEEKEERACAREESPSGNRFVVNLDDTDLEYLHSNGYSDEQLEQMNEDEIAEALGFE